jgi:hypothetical protein
MSESTAGGRAGGKGYQKKYSTRCKELIYSSV